MVWLVWEELVDREEVRLVGEESIDRKVIQIINDPTIGLRRPPCPAGLVLVLVFMV